MAETANFKEAQKITPVNSHTYRGNVPEAWSGYGIAQGGFALGLLTCAARAHMKTTHAKLHQPHTVNIQAQFLRPSPQGPVTFKIEDTKLGRLNSTFHVKLLNPRGEAAIVAYVQQGNLPSGKQPESEKSVALKSKKTGYLESLVPLPPKGDTEGMLANRDPNWTTETGYKMDGTQYPMLAYTTMLIPREYDLESPKHPGLLDRWIRLRSDIGPWTDGALPFLGDTPYVPALDFKSGEDHNNVWMATTSFSIDFKKRLPEEGVEWLLARTSSPVFRGGRADYNTVMVDEDGEIVAIATMIYTMVEGKQRSVTKALNKL